MIQLLLIIASLASVLLGVIVYANDSRNRLNQIYLIFTCISALWLLTNALVMANSPITLGYNQNLFIGRLITPTSLLSAYFLFLYVLSFLSPSKLVPKNVLMMALPVSVIVSFSFSNFNVYHTTEGDLKVGGLYPFYIGVLLLINCFTFALLYRKQNNKGNSHHMSQVSYLRGGFLLSVIPILILGSVPAGIVSSNVQNIAPLFAFIFLITAAIAMIKHKLFDIRPVVARVIAYGGSVLIVAAIYVALMFVVLSQLTGLNMLGSAQKAILIGASIVLALSFEKIKKFFDKFTNQFFYRDAYDGQELLNELNTALVRSVNIEAMLNNAANIVASSLRSEFCTFSIVETQAGNSYGAGTKPFRVSREEANTIADMSGKTSKTVVIGNLDGFKDAKQVLNKYKVDLMTKLDVSDQTIGYLMMGTRKSGSQYSQRDIQLLETVADSVAIAAQNALRFEEIAQFNVTLQKKVDDATAKLQRSNEKLKALDEAKDEFISMASHQLRTPLTSVKGYVSMVLEGDAGKINDQQKTFLDQAYLSSQRMVYLIADLLNVSRLKTGKFIIEAKPTYLPDVIESEISQLYETAKARELKLVFNKPKTFPTLNLDETKIRQVIMNFTDNAIYYTPKGGKITLELKTSKDSVEFTVHDTGIGVPKSEEHHLFVKFYRAGNAKKARPDGTGLGLFMAKKVIAAQGGAIIFKTEEGKGSTFGFTFPRAKLETSVRQLV